MIRRRAFAGGLMRAGAVGALGLRPRLAMAEPPPETTRIRLYRNPRPSPPGCSAPHFVVEGLLRAEGFTQIEYVPTRRAEAERALAAGEIDFRMGFIGSFIVQIDTGAPVVVLSGVHVGCFQLFGRDGIRTVRDLKGKRVGVTELGSGRHLFIVSLLGYIGLDHRRDVRFVESSPAESRQLFADGKIDAYQAFAEEVYELHDRKIGRVLLDSAADRPWSQYFCCVWAANPEFVRKHPVATRRALRALLKATDMCGLEPERTVATLRERGWIPDGEHQAMLRLLKDLPFAKWRATDPEDTVRFYALRLREAGLIKSSPQKILADGTDWRFLNDLKKELKG